MKSREAGWKLDEPNCRPRGEGKVVTWALKNGCAGMRRLQCSASATAKSELGMLVQLGSVATFQIIWNVGFGSGVDISLMLIDVR
jgi:hypothetical protein